LALLELFLLHTGQLFVQLLDGLLVATLRSQVKSFRSSELSLSKDWLEAFAAEVRHLAGCESWLRGLQGRG
jgi:hypothetical protein